MTFRISAGDLATQSERQRPAQDMSGSDCGRLALVQKPRYGQHCLRGLLANMVTKQQELCLAWNTIEYNPNPVQHSLQHPNPAEDVRVSKQKICMNQLQFHSCLNSFVRSDRVWIRRTPSN